MQQNNSFFLGCNYSNRDARSSGWSLYPVPQDIYTNRYGVNVNGNVDDDTFSLLYCDIYFRRLKEELKHTMLLHESVFESQVHELHRLYRRQKELMMEMEETRHHEALYRNSSFHGCRTLSMNSSVSIDQTRNLSCGVNIMNQNEAVYNVDKSEKTVLDLELSVFEDNDMLGEVHEVPNLLREQTLETSKPSNKLQLDLNEPANDEEQTDFMLNQFCSSVASSVKCQQEFGIDLNVSLLSSEEASVVENLEIEEPQASLSVSLHGTYGSEQTRVIVQALPCSNSVLLSRKQYRPLMRGSRKKVKLGSSSKMFKGSDLDLQSSAQATSESHSNQPSVEKGSSSSFPKGKSARNRTSVRRLKPQKKSSNGDKTNLKKGRRTKRKKIKKICLVTERNYQETSAAEAIVDMSRESRQETCNLVTSLSSNLLWFAEISSLVVEDYETDYFESMTLQLTEMRKNSDDNKTAVSNIDLGKQRSSRDKQGKRKCKEDSSFDAFAKGEANEYVQAIGKLIEASGSKWDCETSPPKLKEAFISSVEEKTGVDWGAIKKRKRGSRVAATDFQHMVMNQVV